MPTAAPAATAARRHGGPAARRPGGNGGPAGYGPNGGGGRGGGGRVQPQEDYRLSVDRRPTAVLPLPARRLRIGRTSDNDLVLSDLSISRHHAELRKTSDGKYQIVDLGSHNGTFVNGQRVTSATLTEKDIVGIGHATFRLTDGELREYIDTGDVSLVAQDLVVQVSGGKILLDHVSFPLAERCLVGIIGPSGAGKSTLLGALTGMRPADRGVVLYDNRDLYKDYAELRTRIGLVPQDSIMHTQLTTQRALRYAAELRFPPDTHARERHARVDEVMSELALTRHAETRADKLSGGQLKRVNVALELLTKPSLLFLDEPTSGLDPGLDKSVMEQMRDLAHDGRTVIVVTHSVANLDVCDRLLVLVPGGKVAFFGPPQEGLQLLRPARLGRGVPGVRPVSGPGLGRRVRGLAGLRGVRDPAAGDRPGVQRAEGRGDPGAGPRRRVPPDRDAVPPVRAGHRLRPRLPAVHRPDAGHPRRPDPPGGGQAGARRARGHQLGGRDPADPAHRRRLPVRHRQLDLGTGQGTDDLRTGTGGRPVLRRVSVLQADRAGMSSPSCRP